VSAAFRWSGVALLGLFWLLFISPPEGEPQETRDRRALGLIALGWTAAAFYAAGKERPS
jgi:hypothetical protein